MLITISEDMAPQRRGPTKPAAPTLSQGHQSTQGQGERRLRILRLVRPSHGSYGFHLRGGREHGTGFFISHVEPGTEAYAQGLRTGDQVLKVNDLTVNGALHKEVASLVRAGSEVTLHVKSTGLIPVKNNPDDPLSWVLVDPGNEADPSLDRVDEISKHTGTLSSTGTNSHTGFGNPIQIIVGGAGKHTIGCSICKGPPEKPGIFVQRVREGGIAEEAGLRAGDQILSCNGMSFQHADFQKAVQAMKSSPYLRLEVLRGAGLELVMGESSGYNSSASSETGEENYCPSETDSREGFAQPFPLSTLTRLSGFRDHIQLDSKRDWKEIEAEWAEAEVSEKRTQLNNNHTLLSRKTNPPTSLSKSFVNLAIDEDRCQPSQSTCNTCSHIANGAPPHLTQAKRSNLSKPRSMTDLRQARNDANFKIAMQMSSEEHVSKIMIPSPPKDEQSALLRLEELSSGTSTLLSSNTFSPCSTLHNHSKTCSISSTSSEDSANHAFFSDHVRPGINASLKENRQLLRCRSVPQDSPGLSSEDSDSVLSFPSSTISICQSGSGRFTSKVHIRSPPPPPPPRGNGTKLTRQHRKLKCGHHRKIITSHDPSSPSTSPCASSTSSGGCTEIHSHNACGGGFRRRQSLESLSASSDDSAHWEEVDRCPIVTLRTAARPRPSSSVPSTGIEVSCPHHHEPTMLSNVPPPPPPPPAPIPTSCPSIIPPPPPPPPQQVPSSEGASFCSQILSRQQEITGAATKLRSPDQRPEVAKKPVIDPKKMQHEKLMEEFKKAHALMVAKRQANAAESSTTSS